MKIKSICFATIILFFSSFTSWSQGNDPVKNPNKELNKSADHFMFQLSSDHWLEAPDSIGSKITNASRGFNAYVMIDKAFKSNPKFSFGGGVGISSSNMFFDKLNVQINGNTNTLKFNNLDTSARFDKYKFSTTFAEIPLELRFTSKPMQSNKAFKMAVGVKAGLLIHAHTKGKNLVDANGRIIQSYTEKIYAKNYINSSRLSVTGRIGYGNFCIFGSYAITSVFKDNAAADMKLLQVGLSIGGF